MEGVDWPIFNSNHAHIDFVSPALPRCFYALRLKGIAEDFSRYIAMIFYGRICCWDGATEC